jgi:hypothetical protein
MEVCLLWLCVVLSCVGRGLCDGLITREISSSRGGEYVFWDVLPCKITVDRRCRGTCCLHHQGDDRKYIPEDKSELRADNSTVCRLCVITETSKRGPMFQIWNERKMNDLLYGRSYGSGFLFKILERVQPLAFLSSLIRSRRREVRIVETTKVLLCFISRSVLTSIVALYWMNQSLNWVLCPPNASFFDPQLWQPITIYNVLFPCTQFLLLQLETHPSPVPLIPYVILTFVSKKLYRYTPCRR